MQYIEMTYNRLRRYSILVYHPSAEVNAEHTRQTVAAARSKTVYEPWHRPVEKVLAWPPIGRANRKSKKKSAGARQPRQSSAACVAGNFSSFQV